MSAFLVRALSKKPVHNFQTSHGPRSSSHVATTSQGGSGKATQGRKKKKRWFTSVYFMSKQRTIFFSWASEQLVS